MPNQLYSKLNGNQQGNMMQQFQRFMNQMQGKNPNEMIEQIVASGQLSQQQLNSIQQQAKNMEQQLSAMRSMFGF